MDRTTQTQLVQEVHAGGVRLVLALTGGGSGAISTLLCQAGASRTVLEATVPYSATALTAWIGTQPEQFCSERTARAMALASYLRAGRLAPGERCVGIGATASLASDRPKRGAHRVYVAWQSESTTAVSSLELEKGARTRGEEEQLVAELILNAIAEVTGARARLTLPLRAGEQVEQSRAVAATDEQELVAGRRDLVARGAARVDQRPQAIFPGAFNPLHEGHRQMAEVAAQILQCEVAFEISVENVDKPPLDFLEIQNRLAQFTARDAIWLSRAARFTRKADLFPAATFIVGSDTIERIGHERYYASPQALDEAIESIASQGCRFLVFGREQDGEFRTLDALRLPARLESLCRGVSAEEFRADISSTQLRRQRAAADPE